MSDQRKIRVYIAGPMTNGNGTAFNMGKIHEAISVFRQLVLDGFVPHCPQLSVFCELLFPGAIPYRAWLDLDMSYIDDCDCVFRIPGPSKGADEECRYAKAKGISIYHSIPELYLSTQPVQEMVDANS